MALENENPVVFERTEEREILLADEDDDVVDQFDDREVFDILLENILSDNEPNRATVSRDPRDIDLDII